MHKETREDVLKRLNRLEGQVKGVAKMINEDADCEKVLVQILAVEGAIKNIGKMIIKSHLCHCVKDATEKGNVDILDSFSKIVDKFI